MEHEPEPAEPMLTWLAHVDEMLADGDAADEKLPTPPPESDDDLDGLKAVLQRLHQDRLDQVTAATRPVLGDRPLSFPGAGAGSPQSFGRFVLVREIGRGGCGIVFLARDTLLGREVALKVPRPEVLTDAAASQRFLREGQAAAALHHPSIVPVFEVGQAGPVPYLASHYCEGPTLAQWLTNQQTVPVQAAAQLVQTLAEAIEHAHAHGVLHRDLKPANVLLQPRAEPASDAIPFDPLISDFGLAKLIDSDGTQTRSGAILGTPLYMAPEQAAGQASAIGPATDVYALGVLLYELLTGCPPFRGASDFETLRCVVAEEPQPPRRLRRDVPRDLETICLKCLQKEPSARYPSASELANELGRFVRGEPIRARRAGLAERTLKWMRRRPAAAALSFVTFLFVTLLALWYCTPDPERGGDTNDEQARKERQRRIAAERGAADLLYTETLQKVVKAYEQGQLEEASALIRAFPEPDPELEVRGFEWHYLRGACCSPNSDPVLVHRQSGAEAWAAAFSPDSQNLATAADDHAVRLWPRREWEDPGPAKVIFNEDFKYPDGNLVGQGGWIGKTGNYLPIKGHRADGNIFNEHTKGAAAVCAFPKPTGSFRMLATVLAHGRRGPRTGRSRSCEVIMGYNEKGAFWQWQLLTKSGFTNWELRGVAAAGQPTKPPRLEFPLEISQQGLEKWVTVGIVIDRVTQTNYGTWDFGTVRGRTPAYPLAPEITDAIDHVGLDFDYGDVEPDKDIDKKTGLLNLPNVMVVKNLRVLSVGELSMTPSKTLQGNTLVSTLAYSPDGNLLAWGDYDGRIVVWDTEKQQRIREWSTFRDKVAIRSIAFSSDGTMLATASKRKVDVNPKTMVKLWDVATGEEVAVLTGPTRGVGAVAFSPDGALVAAGGSDDKVRIWDVATRSLVHTWDHPVEPFALAFNRDGSELAVAGSDGGVRLWNVRDRKERIVLRRHTKEVRAVAYSADGRTLATAGDDQKVELWQASTGRHLLTLQVATARINSLSFAADGSALVAACHDGNIVLWRTPGPVGERGAPSEVTGILGPRGGHRPTCCADILRRSITSRS